jgi:hypothetical protein
MVGVACNSVLRENGIHTSLGCREIARPAPRFRDGRLRFVVMAGLL